MYYSAIELLNKIQISVDMTLSGNVGVFRGALILNNGWY
jgi:hypothetical protein